MGLHVSLAAIFSDLSLYQTDTKNEICQSVMLLGDRLYVEKSSVLFPPSLVDHQTKHWRYEWLVILRE